MSSTSILVEKRDGSFQTLLSIAPTQDISSNKHLFAHDSTPSPLSTISSSNTGQQQQQQHRHHHHHHHNRKHKSRTSSSNNNISTRDVGLQVNIQTVKKITFTSEKSDDSSLTTSATTTTPSSPPATIKPPPEVKTVETNTEPLVTKRDMSTSYESSLHLITSSSQTTESSSSTATTASSTKREAKEAQTLTKTLRDQSSETNRPGLFVCDLSSLLSNGIDEPLSLNIKQKS